MNFWQGKNICMRAIEPDDADLLFDALRDLNIQKNEANIRVPMSRKACATFAEEQASKGNDNSSPFLIIEDLNGNKVGWLLRRWMIKGSASFRAACLSFPHIREKATRERRYS